LGLLAEKYSDPTGAALGALILYKVGRLGGWTGWVENLVRDFEWLPDGKILLANLLFDRKERTELALQLALRASRQTILYNTESFSLFARAIATLAGRCRKAGKSRGHWLPRFAGAPYRLGVDLPEHH
jgi:hypothetical protein